MDKKLNIHTPVHGELNETPPGESLNLQSLSAGPTFLEIREGKALEMQPPVKVKIEGTIDAPRKFFEKRKEEHKLLGCYVTYSRDDMKITLQVDEKDTYGSKIEGSLKMNPYLEEFGINRNTTRSIEDMKQFLKMRRFFFVDKDACNNIVANLGKFKARVETEIEQAKDNRGNSKNLLERVVKTDFPTGFNLVIPIFKGSGNSSFPVEVCFSVTDAGTKVWLESVELQELIASTLYEIMNKELEAFKDIVVIEQ